MPNWTKSAHSQPMPDGPRLLHKHSHLGYTDNAFQAMEDEPEAVSEAEQRRLTTEARSRYAEQHEEDVRREQARSALGRLKRAENAARKKGLDPNVVLLKAVTELEELAA